MLISKGFCERRLVLPDRIELSTSPLPMECSTTELRQHAPDYENRPKGPSRRADPCHKGTGFASAGRPSGVPKTAKSARNHVLSSRFAGIGAKFRHGIVGAGQIGLILDPISGPIMAKIRENGHCPLEQWRICIYSVTHLAHRSILPVGRIRAGSRMTDDRDRNEVQSRAPASNPKQDSRRHRLKQALRENLKRRKSQARGRGDPISRPSNGDDVAPYDDSGNKPGE
jgi:hypothetical protein